MSDAPDNTPRLGPDETGKCFVDFPNRVVVILVRKPLELAPTRLDVPIAMWKMVASTIIAAEANGEIARAGGGPRIAVPGN